MEESTLLTCEIGDTFKITRIEENNETRNYLFSLEFLKNTDLLVVQKNKDILILEVFGSRLGIESQLSSNIFGYVKKDILIKSKKYDPNY